MRKKIKNKNNNNNIEMKKNKKPPDKEYYKCVKVPLKHVIKHSIRKFLIICYGFITF